MSATTGKSCRAVSTSTCGSSRAGGWSEGGWHDLFANSLKHQVMKFTSFRIAIVSTAAAGLFAFSSLRDGSIHGTVSPLEGGVRAWAESYTDTLKAPIINGSYDIAGAKPRSEEHTSELQSPCNL